MKCLLLILLPVSLFAQPKKAVIYSKKSGHTINDKVVIWKSPETVEEKLFIGQRTITIGNEQYSIDSSNVITEMDKPVFAFFISLRGKKARCYLYPTDVANEWELLLDTTSAFLLYQLRE